MQFSAAMGVTKTILTGIAMVVGMWICTGIGLCILGIGAVLIFPIARAAMHAVMVGIAIVPLVVILLMPFFFAFAYGMDFWQRLQARKQKRLAVRQAENRAKVSAALKGYQSPPCLRLH